MLFRFISAVLVVIVVASTAARRAIAAPVPILGELPLSDGDICTLRTRLAFDEFFETLDFIGSVSVFEDDASTPQRPIYYLAPFFSADTHQEVIGGQEIATDLLALLDELDRLLATVHADPRDIFRYMAMVDDYAQLASRLFNNPVLPPQEGARRMLDYASGNGPFAAQIAVLPQRIGEALRPLSSSQRRQITAVFLAALGSLGASLSSAERIVAQTDPLQFVVTGLAKLRAKMATLQLGVRHATFVSGMTAQQMRWLSNYRAVRPDVDIRALPTQVLRVLPVSASIDAGGLLGDQVSAPEMIRGVNVSTNGVCGVSTSCTVVVEYTEMGARSALLSTRGASIFPAQFVGEVAAPPDPGTVICDLTTLCQRLVLPMGTGAIGNREILRALAAPGVCRTAAGNASKLVAATVLEFALRDVLFESAQVSVARRRSLAGQIAPLMDSGTRADVFGSASVLRRAFDLQSFITPLGHMLERRMIPRFPDELFEGIVIGSAGPRATTRFNFEGVPIACWKRAPDGRPYLSACVDGAPDADIQLAVSSSLAARNCTPDQRLLECAAAIQASPADAQGFLWADR